MPFWMPWAGLVVLVALLLAHLAVPSTRTWVWKVAGGLAVAEFLALVYFGLVWAPKEMFMSDVGRIIYVHVPHLMACGAAFALNAGCAIAYLMKKSWRTDALAEAAAEVGVYFGAIGVLMGSIWARPTWGVWWDWDPRLISTTVMLLSYVGYLAFRSFTEDPERRATWSSAAAILGFSSVFITYYSVRWWNSLHQVQSTMASIDKPMKVVLFWGNVTFLTFLLAFVIKRYELARARQTGALELPPVQAPKAQVAA
jgi:heme exporter protein C